MYLDKRRHHSFPICTFVWGFLEFQVKVKLTNSALWYHLITVHQGLSVGPENYKSPSDIIASTPGHKRTHTWLCNIEMAVTCSNARAHCNWWPGRSFGPEVSFLFQVQKRARPRECKAQMSNLSHRLLRWFSISRVLCYLFAALSEAESHILTREQLPDGGRLAQARFVARGQGIQLERLSKLLDLPQSVSPLTHP